MFLSFFVLVASRCPSRRSVGAVAAKLGEEEVAVFNTSYRCVLCLEVLCDNYFPSTV
jgi:hypothetical protein